MADSFFHELEYEREMGRLIGLQIAHNVRSVNHSQFADDVLLLGGASRIITRHFKQMLESYLEVSGAKVKNLKIQIYGLNCPKHIL